MRKILVLSVLFLIFGCKKEPSMVEVSKKINQLILNNKFKDALILIENHPYISKDDAEYWSTKGFIFYKMNDKTKANQYFLKYVLLAEKHETFLKHDDKSTDMGNFIILQVVNNKTAKLKQTKIKSKWKVDYQMSDFFKDIESETAEKALEMIYQ